MNPGRLARGPNAVRVGPRISRTMVAACGLAAWIATFGMGARADLATDRDILTVTTNNIIAVFRGPDLFRITNRLTNEQYLRPPTPFRGMLDLGLLEPTGRPLTGDFWRKGRNDLSAQFVAKDLTRTVYMNVVIDPDTEDITITLWGESLKEGAAGLKWVMQGLDLTGGRLVLPVQGGRYLDDNTPFNDMTFHYPGAWEAQMMVWEDKLNSGGMVVYSRDDEYRYKKLRLSRKGPRVDVGFETEAVAPWKPTGSVKAVEWRINAYKGDWKVPATGYRNLMHYSRPPVPLKGSRGWVTDIRAAVSLDSKTPDAALLDTLARELQPNRILLILPLWRQEGYDPNVADYTPREGIHDFVERAHEFGFHVMLPIEPPGSNPQSSDYKKAQRVRVRDPATGKPGDSGPLSFASYNPASQGFRSLLIERLTVMMDDVKPDVIFLLGGGAHPNDGGGLIDNRTFSQGAIAMHRAILTAFPDLLLGSEEMNELISPYSTITIRSQASALPPHPISTLLFSNTTFPVAAPPSGVPALTALEGQGVFPILSIASPDDLKSPKPELAALLKLAKVWGEKGVLPDWGSPWKGALMRWYGTDGVVISAEKSKDGVTIRRANETLAEHPLKPARPPAEPH